MLYAFCAAAATAGVAHQAQHPRSKLQTSSRPAQGHHVGSQGLPPARDRASHRHGYGANTDVPATSQTFRGTVTGAAWG